MPRDLAMVQPTSFPVFLDIELKRRTNVISRRKATVFVSNMDLAVRFYTDVLGLKLASRFGDNLATIDTGNGLTIALHPNSL